MVPREFGGINIMPKNWLECSTVTAWVRQCKGTASRGAIELHPAELKGGKLVWEVDGSNIMIRVGNRVVVLDVSHINQPDSPSGSGERGEE